MTGKSSVKIASETRFTYKLTQDVQCHDPAAPALPDAPATDTLTLTDGTNVSGSWVGIDAGSISFQVNEQASTYSESQVSAVTFAAPATPPPPADATQPISMGHSIDEVVKILGQPARIYDLDSKKIYVYEKLKVTFVDGKVTAVE